MNRVQAVAVDWQADADEERWFSGVDGAMGDLVERFGSGSGPSVWLALAELCLRTAVFELEESPKARGDAKVTLGWQAAALESAANLLSGVLGPCDLRALRALSWRLDGLRARLGGGRWRR
jgi:hypothetical protein